MVREARGRVEQTFADSANMPGHELQRKEERLQLCEAVSNLPEAQRQAIELHHFLGMPITQVANEMGKLQAAVAGFAKTRT